MSTSLKQAKRTRELAGYSAAEASDGGLDTDFAKVDLHRSLILVVF
jgi:hypothetical protein